MAEMNEGSHLAADGTMEDLGHNLRLAAAFLPESIDIDPGLQAYENKLAMKIWHPAQKTQGVRQWAKHLALVGHMGGICIPESWADFFTLTLLDPERFEWAKAFLGSKAWSLVIDDNSSEA
jgi:hypothetical protein